MFVKKVISIATNAAMILAPFVVIGTATHATPASAETYWGCYSGYQFEVDDGAARCYKAGTTEFGSPLGCPRIDTPYGPFGSSLRQDANGVNDVCATVVAGITFTAEVICGPGWTMDRRSGADRCKKGQPSDSRQPSKTVSR
jgi:hypothetical protein